VRDTIFSLRLDPELRERLREEAKAQKASDSAIIRKAIEVYLWSCKNERAIGRWPL
jgi:predicted transcriptional regulator